MVPPCEPLSATGFSLSGHGLGTAAPGRRLRARSGHGLMRENGNESAPARRGCVSMGFWGAQRAGEWPRRVRRARSGSIRHQRADALGDGVAVVRLEDRRAGFAELARELCRAVKPDVRITFTAG